MTNPTDTAFAPVAIGTSPAGVEWVAYKAEHVASMTARLAMLNAEPTASNAKPAASNAKPADYLENCKALRSLCAGRRSQNLFRSPEGALVYLGRYGESANKVCELIRALNGDVLGYHNTNTHDTGGKGHRVEFLLGSAAASFIARKIGMAELRADLALDA